MAHVDTDLVSTARFQFHGEKRRAGKPFAHAVVRHRRAAPGDDRHALAILGVPADRRIDLSLTGRIANDHGEVFTSHRATLQLPDDVCVGHEAAGNDAKTTGLLVEAMYHACARHLSERRVMMQQCIHQGAGRIAGCRVHDQAGRLVDNVNRRVDVNPRQRQVFGTGLRPAVTAAIVGRCGGSGQAQAQRFTADEPLPCARRSFIEGQQAIGDPALQAVARMHREQAGGHAVETHPGIGIGRTRNLFDSVWRCPIVPGSIVRIGQRKRSGSGGPRA